MSAGNHRDGRHHPRHVQATRRVEIHKDKLSILRPRNNFWKIALLKRYVPAQHARNGRVCDSAAAHLHARTRAATERLSMRVRETPWHVAHSISTCDDVHMSMSTRMAMVAGTCAAACHRSRGCEPKFFADTTLDDDFGAFGATHDHAAPQPSPSSSAARQHRLQHQYPQHASSASVSAVCDSMSAAVAHPSAGSACVRAWHGPGACASDAVGAVRCMCCATRAASELLCLSSHIGYVCDIS